VHELFDYKDGNLIWKFAKSRRVKAGEIAGYLGDEGYIDVGVDGGIYKAHRLIYFYHNGYFPSFIDHIDGNRSNNKIDNLRPATINENARNSKKPSHNTSGYKGVCWDKNRSKWMAYITINNKFKSLGRYDQIEDAHLAYTNAAKLHFGNFARIEK